MQIVNANFLSYHFTKQTFCHREIRIYKASPLELRFTDDYVLGSTLHLEYLHLWILCHQMFMVLYPVFIRPNRVRCGKSTQLNEIANILSAYWIKQTLLHYFNLIVYSNTAPSGYLSGLVIFVCFELFQWQHVKKQYRGKTHYK